MVERVKEELLKAIGQFRISQVKITEQMDGGAKIEIQGYINEEEMIRVREILEKYK